MFVDVCAHDENVCSNRQAVKLVTYVENVLCKWGHWRTFAKQKPSRVQLDCLPAVHRGSAHLIHINYPSAPACPCAMTQRDNCGSRLLQPLVRVTKIGTQVSCHSKSVFFRSLSIKLSRPHAKMPRGEERRPSQGSNECFWNGKQ